MINNRTLFLDEDQEIPFNITHKGESDTWQYVIEKRPAHGTILGIPPNLRYVPNANYHGKDNLRYFVQDGDQRSNTATIRLWVFPVNDPPVSEDRHVSGKEDGSVPIHLVGKDLDHNELYFTIYDFPKHGILQGTHKNRVYIPDPGFHGIDHFTFVAEDGHDSSKVHKVTINIQKKSKEERFRTELGQLIRNGGIAIGKGDNPEELYQPGKYIPASILKVITAMAALENLGEEYRFQTHVYIDSRRNLIIKGFGDPTLSSKSWHEIAKILQSKGFFRKPLNKLLLDDTLFKDSEPINGLDSDSILYYNSPPGALATNGNKAKVKIKKRSRRKAKIYSSNKATPVTATVRRRTRYMPSGHHFINIAKNSAAGTRYTGELVQGIFKQYGGYFQGETKIAATPKGLTPVIRYKSKTGLPEVIKKMLHNSDNFIANQLLFIMAFEHSNRAVSFQEGVTLLEQYLTNQVGLNKKDFAIYEGAGLSRDNRIGLQAMLKVLNFIAPEKNMLSPLFESRFPDLAKTGKEWNILAKSGTMKEIYNLAGFIQVDPTHWKPFVIMLNQKQSNRDRVLQLIGDYYQN